MNVIEIDVCFLEPPGPFEKTVEALDRMAPGDELRVLIHREPQPLYQMLRNNGFRYRTEQTPEGLFRIVIRHAGSAPG
ncbi:MAG: DUF2249 domain-containing protein [Burkholderiaceae bacterium]